MSDGTCLLCGGALPSLTYRGNPRKWCSESCRTNAAYLRAKERGTAYYPRCSIRVSTCEMCGRLWCGKRGTWAPRACPWPECRKALNAKRGRERYAANPDADKLRVATFRAQISDEQAAAYRERRRKWVADNGGRSAVNKDHDHLRRARKAGVGSERFDPREVFERDGWLCGICDRPIDQSLRHPDPMSVSLDHIVPISLGGAHSRVNTQPAHLSCNVRRGAKPLEDVAAA